MEDDHLSRPSAAEMIADVVVGVMMIAIFIAIGAFLSTLGPCDPETDVVTLDERACNNK